VVTTKYIVQPIMALLRKLQPCEGAAVHVVYVYPGVVHLASFARSIIFGITTTQWYWCPKCFRNVYMTDMRTLGIRPDGWKMTRNDNLYNNKKVKRYCIAVNGSILWHSYSTNNKENKFWISAFTALELKMLPAVNGV